MQYCNIAIHQTPRRGAQLCTLKIKTVTLYMKYGHAATRRPAAHATSLGLSLIPRKRREIPLAL